MNVTLLQMALVMACGVVWQLFKPAGLTAEQTRLVLTSVVYYVLLPALILDVLWTADIGVHSLQYTLLGIGSLIFCMLCIWAIGRLFKYSRQSLGAMLLAIFPNVTYLGLPVLEQTFGHWGRSVAIQIDLFATSPFLFTIGLMVVSRYSSEVQTPSKSFLSYLNAPPFWAAGLAVILNINGISCADWLVGVLQKLAAAVIPLMLFSLGLSLNWRAMKLVNLPTVLWVTVVKMCLMPAFALLLATQLTLENDHKAAAILDLAMPSMILGIVFCDRFRLDTGLYAMTVTVTTALSLLILPFWYEQLHCWQLL